MRRKVFLGGNVIIGPNRKHPFETSPCIIKDLTKDGARLQLRSGVNVTETFSFEIPTKQCVLQARLVWRKGDLAGISFDGFIHGSKQLASFERLAGNGDWRN